jgi:hypothetical protein
MSTWNRGSRARAGLIARETIASSDETLRKQNCAYPRIIKTGEAIMQFILDLLWDHSRSGYLTAMAKQEAHT